MYLYAVCMNTSDSARPDDWWIEYFWADDTDHAEEQAESANPNCAVVCVGITPSPHGGYFRWDGESDVQVR